MLIINCVYNHNLFNLEWLNSYNRFNLNATLHTHLSSKNTYNSINLKTITGVICLVKETI
jgi:hypothetical protein